MPVFFPPDGANFIAVAGSTANTYDTILFSDSNGITFGLNGSVLTASHNGLTQAIVGILAGANTLTSGSLSFANSNNITFGLNTNGVLTASYGGGGAGGAAISAGANSQNTGTVVFANSNGITFGMDTNGVLTASVSPPASQGDGVNILAAGSQTANTTGTVLFQNSNGITFGMSNSSVITASHNGITQQSTQPVAAQAANGSFLFSTLGFINTNGVSFVTSTDGIRASVREDWLSTQSNQAVSAANGSFAFQTLTFANSNGISFSTGTQGLFASYNGITQQSTQPVAAQANNGSFAFSTLAFVNTNGVSFVTSTDGLRASVREDWLSTQSNQAVSGANGSFTFQTLTFANSNGISFSTGTQGLFASYTVPTQSVQPAVNLSAGTQLADSGTVLFVNSNGISFGLSGSSALTASYTVPTQSVQPGIQSISAGTAALTTGQVIFADSNNVSFSVTTGGQIVASASFNQTVQPVAASGSNGSFNFSTLSFGASNGLTFYTTNGSLVGSYTVPTQSIQTQNMVSIQGSTGAISFGNANGITFGFNASTITASHNALTSQSNQAVSAANGSFAFQTLALADSNGISFSTGTQGLYASHNGITQQSTQPVAASGSNGSFNFSTLSFGSSNGMHFYTTNGSIVGSYTQAAQTDQTLGFFATSNTTQNSSTTLDARSLTLQGAGIASVGFSNGSVIISVPSGGGAGDGVNILAAGTQTANTTGTVLFQNSNGISFGMSNNSVITASYTVPTQSNQTLGFYAVSNTTGASSSSAGFDARSISIQGAGNVSVGFSNGSVVISGAGGGGGGAALGISTAGNTQGTSGLFTSGSYVFEGSNSLSLSQITGAGGVQTLRIIPAMSVLTNGNGISMSSNGSTMSVIANLGYSGANGSNTFFTLSFANSNGISFSTGTQGLYASHNGITSQTNQTLGFYAVSNTTGQSSSSAGFDARSISIQGAGVASVGFSNGSIIVSVPAGGGGGFTGGMSNVGNTAGTSGLVSNQLVIVGSDNITLSQSVNGGSATLSIIGPSPGAGGAYSQYWANPPWQGNSNALISNITATRLTRRPLLFPFNVGGNLTAGELHWLMSRATSGSNAFTLDLGIYSYVNSTQLSLIGSNQNVYSNTATASISAVRLFEASIGTNFSTLPPGQYVLAMMFSANGGNTASMNYSLIGAATNNPANETKVVYGTDQYHTYTSHQDMLFWGIYTATSANLPGSIALSHVSANINSKLPIYFTLGNHV